MHHIFLKKLIRIGYLYIENRKLILIFMMQVSYRADETLGEIHPPRRRVLTKKKQQEQEEIPDQKKIDLGELVLKHKLQLIKKNFLSKLRLNSVYRQVPQENIDHFQDNEESEYENCAKLRKALEKTQGLKLSQIFLTCWSFLNIIQISSLVFILSIMITFKQTEDNEAFVVYKLLSIIAYLLDVLLNFASQRFENGKQLKTLQEIGHNYLENGFVIDIISILLLPLDVLISETLFTVVVAFVMLIKLWSNIKKFQRFQYLYVGSTEKQQYYGLVKVFITNFVIGHFLSIFLNLMAGLHLQTSWYNKMSIQNQPWLIKYLWGYYWGTNIMLTVGFGDLAANNYYQALILIFIQTFSCITLAYNISQVGALISSIRQNSLEKKKKLKFFHRMCQENEISSDLESKITNFIEKSYQIKEAFQYDEYDSVLESLPKNMQSEYRKQANRILFDGLGFLNNLSKRTMLKLAETIERKICHPDEIIFRKGSICEFIILQKGLIQYTCRSGAHSHLNGKKIQTLKVEGKEKPKLLSLDFIKNKPLVCDIKSATYSIMYKMKLQNFFEALKDSQMDYQLFCVLRDKDNNIIDENNLYPCSICKKQYHTKFDCSRLHYRPMKQLIILNYLQKQSKMQNKRIPFLRGRNKYHLFEEIGNIENCQRCFIARYLDEEQKKQIELIRNFEQKKLSFYQNPQSDRKSTFEQNKTLGKKILAENENVITRLENMIALSTKPQTEFWNVQSDQGTNFRYYFRKDNPSRFKQTNSYKLKAKKKPKSMGLL